MRRGFGILLVQNMRGVLIREVPQNLAARITAQRARNYALSRPLYTPPPPQQSSALIAHRVLRVYFRTFYECGGRNLRDVYSLVFQSELRTFILLGGRVSLKEEPLKTSSKTNVSLYKGGIKC